jgi:hypothetical protein
MTCGPLIRRWTPFCLAAVFLISGCEGYTSSADVQKARRVAAVHKKPVRPAAKAARESAQAVTPSAVSDGPPYVGLAEAQLVARLGQPTAESEEPPGKTWRYQNKSCTVDFMLYPDVETRIYRALAYEVINDDQSAAGKRLCLAELEARTHER